MWKDKKFNKYLIYVSIYFVAPSSSFHAGWNKNELYMDSITTGKILLYLIYSPLVGCNLVANHTSNSRMRSNEYLK